MNKTLEKLWHEHFAEDCAITNTKEEKALIKKSNEAHQKINEILTKEQEEAVGKYIEELYEIESFFIKKAFFKGCNFATSFLLEIIFFEKD